MPVSINTNYAASAAANNLGLSQSMLQKSLNRLSSGSRVLSPADDAGGVAVSMRLSAQAKRSGSAGVNIQNAISLLQNQDGAIKIAGKIVERMAELHSLYNDATKNADDKALYNVEFKALQTQLQNVSNQTFNGVPMFGTSSTSIIVNAQGDQTLTVAAKPMSSTAEPIGLLISITALSSATTIYGAITTGQDKLANYRANNGAEQNGLNFADELLDLNKINLEAAAGRIVDVDVAEESTQLAKWTTLTQAGTAMLAQANQATALVLKLIGQ